jgi:hypothetical protein
MKNLINQLNVHSIKLRYVLLLAIWLPVTAFAQLKKSGPARQTTAKASVTKNARMHAGDTLTLSLPFWDDFSVPDGHLAHPSHWIINEKVFVNDGQAINPPSINVASFDGYNENGLPYSTIPEDTGYGDTLASQFIDLDAVAAMYRDDIYLSFFYQAGGNSDIPNEDDYLKLEFKSDKGWREIHKFEVKSNTDPTLFYDTAIQIPQDIPNSDATYFHDEFQFRFTSYGKISGSYDAWHLDYVYLNRRVEDNEERINEADDPTRVNEYDKNTNISDRTTTKPFTTIFTNGYYSMPRNHFNEKKHLTKPFVFMYSLKHVTFLQPVSYTSRFTITHYKDNIPTTTFDGILETSDFNLLPILEHATDQIHALPDTSTFRAPGADLTNVVVKIAIEGGDDVPAKDYYARYAPIKFRSNDTLQHTFTLSDYYAYDDGVAEYAMSLEAQGNQFAYRFVMDEAVGTDTLNGAYIYFPFAGGTAPETMQIFIFPDKAGKPDSMWIYRQTVPVTRTANNLFSEIPFTQGVLVQDTFYIGYLETLTGEPDLIRIGLDASHDTNQHMFYRNTVYHKWLQDDGFTGSVMIRPRFGKATVITGIEDDPNPVSIYPNPTQGEFYMKGRVDNLQVITLTGQRVSFRVEHMEDTKKIMLQGATPGLYIVRYQSGSKIYTNKILVRE